MRSTKLAAALVCAGLITAPAAYAMPVDPVKITVKSSDAPPPPPSSIAMSAGDEYEALRAPQTVIASEPAVAAEPVAPSAPTGFDWVSAAIGAAAAAGLALVTLATVGTRRRAASA
jgi:hypothetical protein